MQMEKMGNAYRSLVLKPQWKEPLGKPRCSWEYSKVDLGEVL